MDEKTCDNCLLYKTKSNQALSQHKRVCLQNTAAGLPKGASKWHCKICNQYFGSKRAQKAHNKEVGHRKTDFIDRDVVLEELTCSFCHKHKNVSVGGMKNHERACYKNPDKVAGHSRKMSDDQKAKLSEIMKERHRKNIATKWTNPHIQTSYAEQFFTRVVENEFEDKNVLRELPMDKYFFDFAWPHKMKAIEIDGQQHDREYQRTSDERKDAKAAELGWSVLRIKFADMYREPKKYIKIANDFIHN